MSKLNFSKGKLVKFISSKGFYVAIGLCLVGAGFATWLAVDRTITGIEKSNNQIIQGEQQYNEFPPLEETDKKQPDIPKEESKPSTQTVKPSSEVAKPSVPSSSSSTPSSSSAPSSKPAESSKPAVTPPPLPTLSYALPVKGSIISQFSNGELVKNVTLNDWRTHDGVDITADKDTDVLASADGTVADIKSDPLWGTVVTISHIDGRQTIYAGLNEILPVKVGDAVMSKQVIGRVSGVPCEAGKTPHVHFAMKKDGTWADPLSVMAKAG